MELIMKNCALFFHSFYRVNFRHLKGDFFKAYFINLI